MDASIGRHARAKFSYKALYEADLAVRKGDVVEIVEVVVAGQWWKVRKPVEEGAGAEGNVPMAYFDLLDDPADEEEPLAPTPPPIPLSTRPSAGDAPADTSGPGSKPPSVVRATSQGDAAASAQQARNGSPLGVSEAAARLGRPSPLRPTTGSPLVQDGDGSAVDEPEPTYTSLKDRMAALNGRGLAGAAPGGRPSPNVPARTASAASVPTIAGRPQSASADTLPEVDTMRLSAQASSAGSTLRAAPAVPPRLPPRLPARRPSSQASSSTDVMGADVVLASSFQPPATSAVVAGALRKPPPIPTKRPPASPVLAPSPSHTPSSVDADRPPPPPRRQLGLAPPTAMPRAPPRPPTPPPLTFTLTVPIPQARELTAAELDLGSQWFSRQPLILPEPLLRLPHATLAAGGQFSGSPGGSSELNLGILHGDRSRSFVRIQWGAGVPASAPLVNQQQTKPPRPRTVAELDFAAEQYGERVAAWAESREGTVVGRGECWDLADHALKEVSAALAIESSSSSSSRSSRGDPAVGGLAEAIGISFGEVVYVNVACNVGWGPERRIRRGDILQFVHATFKSFYSDGSTSTSTAGNPTTGHTAVVVADWSGRGAESVCVLQANVGGSPLTQPGEFSLGDLVSGEVRAFRPMSSDWSGGPVRPAP